MADDILKKACQSGEDKHLSMTEAESKEFLKGYGIPVVDEVLVKTPAEAADAASGIGFPVVVKGHGKNLLHKTESSAVCLNLYDEKSVLEAVREMKQRLGDVLEGFLVQPQVMGRREFVCGLFVDDQFGPVVMFGLGGIFTEVLSDVSFRLAPLTEADCLEMLDELRSKALLGSFRGEAPADKEILIKTLLGLSKIAVENPDIQEIDINPMIIKPDGTPVAVDALIVRGPGRQREYLPKIEPGVIAALFHPRSVAFVGASGKMGKWGYTLMTNVLGGGYDGDVYLVNHKGGTIAGRKVYRSVTEIPGHVDVAVVTIPAAKVAGLIPQFKEKGISYMLLIASGFAEIGPEGAKREKELVRLARENQIYLIGPNTMGICNPHIKFYCTGTHVRPKPGGVGVVAQSGNMGNQLLAFAEFQGIGIRGFCGSGNEAMITIEDYIDAFEVDPTTDTVMLYIESVKNGRRFYESARRVGKKKPIILLKGGQTEAGSKAAASHTGALSSNIRVFDAVCRQSGIVKVEKPSDLLDLSASFSSVPLPKGNRIAIMTLGGGWGVVASDLCEFYSLEIPPLSAEIIAEIDKILPPYWSRGNPVDLVGENDPTIPVRVMELLMKWDGCDAVINLGILGRRHMLSRQADSAQKADPTCPPDFLEKAMNALNEYEKNYITHVVKLMETYEKPVLGVSILTEDEDLTVNEVPGHRYKGIFFPTPEQAVKSMAKMYEYYRFLVREGVM